MQQTTLEYDRWLESQVEILRHGHYEQLDVDNLIEELEALGRAEKSAVKSLVYQILLHLLLVDYWREESEYNKQHWLAEIDAFQLQLEDKLTANLTKLIEEELLRLYAKASKNAARKSRLSTERFPSLCPYSIEDIKSRG